MKTLIIFYYLLCLTLLIHSQENNSSGKYYDGYIVTINNDTISGFIKDLDWVKNPKEISFKLGIDGKPNSYDVNNLLAFYSYETKRRYVARKVSINISSHWTSNLSNSSVPEMKDETLFLEEIILGRQYSLFSFTDEENRGHHFIEDNSSDDIDELIYHKYKKTEYVISARTKYIGQLKHFFKDCEESMKKLDNLKYDIRPITAVFYDYFECIGDYVEVDESKQKKPPIYLNFSGGMSISSLKFREGLGDVQEGLVNNGVISSAAPFLSGDLIFFIGKRHYLISYFTSFEYYYRNYSSDYAYNSGEGLFERIHEFDLNIKSQFLDLGLGIIYEFRAKQKISPFVKLGIISHIVLKNEASFRHTRILVDDPQNNSEVLTTLINNGAHEKWGILPSFGLGLHIYDFELGFDFTYNYAGYTTVIALPDVELFYKIKVGYRIRLNKE